MIEAGKLFKLMIYPNKTHGISGTAARTHLFSTMDRFWQCEMGE
jgi:dipeptidyl aminopeptidase/acylaminoacyl peptidase